MKITITNPLLALDIQIAVSKEETRYYLQSFHVEKAESGGIVLVSTDGDRMLVIHDPAGEIEGDANPIKLPSWFLKELKAQMKGKRDGDCKLVIEGDIRASSVSLFWVDKQILRADGVFIDGSFPAWSRVMPVIDHSKPLVKGTFNADYYEAFARLYPSGGIASSLI